MHTYIQKQKKRRKEREVERMKVNSSKESKEKAKKKRKERKTCIHIERHTYKLSALVTIEISARSVCLDLETINLSYCYPCSVFFVASYLQHVYRVLSVKRKRDCSV